MSIATYWTKDKYKTFVKMQNNRSPSAFHNVEEHPKGSRRSSGSAHRQRNTIYTNQQKVILFLTKEHLKEMLDLKERGEEPSYLIVDLEELFFIQHE